MFTGPLFFFLSNVHFLFFLLLFTEIARDSSKSFSRKCRTVGSFSASAAPRLPPSPPRAEGFEEVILFRDVVCAQRLVITLNRSGGDGRDPKTTRLGLHSAALCGGAAGICSPIHGGSTAPRPAAAGAFCFQIARIFSYLFIFLSKLRRVCRGINAGNVAKPPLNCKVEA